MVKELINLDNYTPEQLADISTEITNRRIEKLEQDVQQIKDEYPIPNRVQRRLDKERKKKVIQWLGGKDSPAYQKISRKVFAEMERNYKDYFGIPRYDELPKKNIQSAFDYIRRWEPSTNNKMEIEAMNQQLNLLDAN